MTIDTDDAAEVIRLDRAAIERKVHACLDEWRKRLSGRAVDETRQMLRETLGGPSR